MLEGIDVVSSCLVKDLKPASQGLPVRAVYAIRNRATGNLYVGSSEHVARRFRHHVIFSIDSGVCFLPFIGFSANSILVL